MKTISTLLFLLGGTLLSLLRAQNNFDLRIDTFSLPGLPGLHSFAAAQHEGKWLLLGGRKDGLHPKNGGFQTSSANQVAYVFDPVAGQVFQRPLTGLPDTLQEQLCSANIEFFQHGETLCFVGGYGRSETVQDHRTYPYLTLVDVPGLVAAVIGNDSLLVPHFQQVRDTFFAVTGAQLQVLNDTFYLVGGHRFEGLYSANAGANNVQFYTDAIRKFTLEPAAEGWQVAHKSEMKDELNLHRRDYNLAPHFHLGGEPGLAVFSGVFQPGLALLPFLNIVEIRPSGHAPVNGFSQFLANYHCAKLPLYSPAGDAMHTLFFGGMSRYHLNADDSLLQDNRIPFVKTVSRVSRLADGSYAEVAFDTELPFYTGTGAEFLPAEGLPTLPNGVVDYDLLPDGDNLLGYIVGGIVTPDNLPNPFIGNMTGQTSASATLMKVILEKNPPISALETPVALDGRSDLGMGVFPNPATERWNVQFQLPRPLGLLFTLQDASGKIVRQLDLGKQAAGPGQFGLSAEGLSAGAFLLTLNAGGIFTETQTIVKQ